MLSFIRIHCWTSSRFLCGYFSLFVMHAHAWKGSNLWTGASYICAGDAVIHRRFHFAGRMHGMDGRVICTSEHSAQNRSEVNELLYGSILHLSLCMVISPLAAIMDWSGVCVCVCACLISFFNPWWLGRVVVSPDKTWGYKAALSL